MRIYFACWTDGTRSSLTVGPRSCVYKVHDNETQYFCNRREAAQLLGYLREYRREGRCSIKVMREAKG